MYESQLWLGLRQKDINHIEAFINDVPAEDSEDISLDLDQTSGPSLQSAALTYICGRSQILFLFFCSA